MRKIILAVALALAIPLGGCVTTGVPAIDAITTGIKNPVGTQTLVTVEASYGAVLSAAVTYRRLCIAKQFQLVGATCRDTVLKMQTANKYAYAQIVVARQFVRDNPNTVTAQTILATVTQAVDAFRSVTPNIGAN